MYLRPIWTKQKPYWALVKSVRQGKKVRQEVVAYLGALQKKEQSQARALAQKLGLKTNAPELFDPPLKEDIVQVRLKGVALERARQFGNVYLGMKLWEMAGFDQFFEKHFPAGSETVPWATMAMLITIARLCEPSSELHIAERWIHQTALCDILLLNEGHINDDRLYRILDKMIPLKESLEIHLKDRWKTLFDKTFDIMLYDVTSIYFEGQAEGNPQAKRGHSRDHRPDCKQVCLGLVVTRDGLPIGYEIFSGDTHDSKTVKGIVDTLEARYGKGGRIWVWDRGMLHRGIFPWMNDGGREYVMALPKATIYKYATLLDKSDGWQQVNDRDVEVQYVTLPDPDTKDLFVLCRSLDRKAKEQAIHNLFIERIEKSLSILKRRLQKAKSVVPLNRVERQIGRLLQRYQRGGKFFKIVCHSNSENAGGIHLEWSYDEAHVARRMEGCYLLRTNIRNWSPKDIWNTYIQLTQVESAFRIQKSQLKIRPVHHQTSKRVQAHIFICFLTYCLWKILEQWQARAGLGNAPKTILEEFRQIQSADVHLPTSNGHVIRLRCVIRPEKHQQILLQRLGIQIPQRMALPEGL